MSDFDDFDAIMENYEVGDFSGFMLSDDEIAQAKKERKEQIQRDVKELRELMEKAEKAETEGGKLSNNDIRRLKALSKDQLVVITAMNDDVDIDELVDMENGDIKEERESGPSPSEMLELLDKGLAEVVSTDGSVGIRRTEVKSEEETSEDDLVGLFTGLIKKVDDAAKTDSLDGLCVPELVKIEEAMSKICDDDSCVSEPAKKEKAYYKWIDGEPATIKCVTKKFWELNKHLDDSHSPENANLRKALEEIGINETAESVYEVNMTEEEMVSKMAEKGIVMRANKIFNSKV